jgi:hypothetical protein
MHSGKFDLRKVVNSLTELKYELDNLKSDINDLISKLYGLKTEEEAIMIKFSKCIGTKILSL